jgi:hypothetical protein
MDDIGAEDRLWKPIVIALTPGQSEFLVLERTPEAGWQIQK